jgi:hypothetical protein
LICKPATGQCVQCLSNSHCDGLNTETNIVGDRAIEHVCSNDNRCVNGCSSCVDSTDCTELGSGFSCVEHLKSGGKLCLLNATNESSCTRPWVYDSTIHVCAPPPTASCQALAEFGLPCTFENTARCGMDDINDGATCGAEGCTYGCLEDVGGTPHYRSEWCPSGVACEQGSCI